MTLNDWKNGGKHFDYNGRSIFYHDEGEGEPLVLVHGFPTASWDWHRIWPDLTQRFRAIAPDMIGLGFSDKPANYQYSIHDQAALHERLLQVLGVTQAHLLAHDYGDTVAQELLARQREGKLRFEIKSVCLLNGGLFPGAYRPLLTQKLLMSPLGALLGPLLPESAFRRRFASIFGEQTKPTGEELQDFWQLLVFNNGRRVTHKVIQYMKERGRLAERWTGALQKTKVPLRLIDGATDPISGAHMAAAYRELIPNPDVILLDGIGHYPQIEDPESVTWEFLSFHERVSDEQNLSG